MGESSRRKKMLGADYGKGSEWDEILLRAVGRQPETLERVEKPLQVGETVATLAVIGAFRNLRETPIERSQIGLQKISSPIVGSELQLVGKYGEEEFSIDGVGFVFVEPLQMALTLKSMWLNNDSAQPPPAALVEILQNPESELFQTISQVVCAVAIATGQPD
jgi:hypothetical protein